MNLHGTQLYENSLIILPVRNRNSWNLWTLKSKSRRSKPKWNIMFPNEMFWTTKYGFVSKIVFLWSLGASSRLQSWIFLTPYGSFHYCLNISSLHSVLLYCNSPYLSCLTQDLTISLETTIIFKTPAALFITPQGNYENREVLILYILKTKKMRHQNIVTPLVLAQYCFPYDIDYFQRDNKHITRGVTTFST